MAVTEVFGVEHERKEEDGRGKRGEKDRMRKVSGGEVRDRARKGSGNW